MVWGLAGDDRPRRSRANRCAQPLRRDSTRRAAHFCAKGISQTDREMTKEQLKQLETDLWAAADNLRANSDLKSSEYSTPVLGLIFLKFADNNYRRHDAEIIAEYQKVKGTRREKKISDIAIEKCGFYLPDHARYEYLLN